MTSNDTEGTKYISETNPNIGMYRECVQRGYLFGITTLLLSISGSFFTHNIFRKYLPYGPNGVIGVSCAFGIVSSYYVTVKTTQNCKRAWVAAEDRHTILNPILEKNRNSGEENED